MLFTGGAVLGGRGALVDEAAPLGGGGEAGGSGGALDAAQGREPQSGLAPAVASSPGRTVATWEHASVSP